jgi:hypothetical protein
MNNSAINVPTIADAALPQRYEAARAAIAECEQIDECKTWSDKAAALASYARQAKDDSLRVMAVRIQARAERRCGELLKLVPRADKSTRYGQAGALPPVTRTQAASNAGLSEHQRKTALRLAAIPAPVFERQVESVSPPTVTKLAEQGITSRASGQSSSLWAAVDADTREACETLERFARFCARTDPSGIARSVNAREAAALGQCITTADQWLDRLAASLVSEG